MKREYLGIYIGKNSVEAACFSGKWPYPEVDSIRLFSKASPPSIDAQLSDILSNFSPSRKRRIGIALPRDEVFIREIKFPSLSPNEARQSISMSLKMHCHLPVEHIAYDVHIFQRDGITTALLLYCQKTKIDSILNVLNAAGHSKSLSFICPVSIVFDTVAREMEQGQQEGRFVLCYPSNNGLALSFHGKECWEGSIRIKSSDLNAVKLKEELIEYIKKIRPDWADKDDSIAFFALSYDEICPEFSMHPLCKRLFPLLKDKDALKGRSFEMMAAMTAAVCSRLFTPVSLHGPRRRPIRIKLRLKPFYLVACLSAAAMIGISLPLYNQYKENASLLSSLKKRRSIVEGSIAPLKEKTEEVKQIKQQIDDLEFFFKEYPNILDVLDELARLSPDDVWVKNFNLSSGTMRFSVEGKNAVSILSEWRKSRYFDEVKLVSPVNKSSDGTERFSVEIRLKKQERKKDDKKKK